MSPTPAETPLAVVAAEAGQTRQTLNLSGSLTARQSARLSPQVATLVTLTFLPALLVSVLKVTRRTA